MEKTKTMDEIAMQYAEVRNAVKDKMRELINTNGKMIDGQYNGMNYIPTESQKKNLALFSDIQITSVGINDKVSGGIYVETKKGSYTAFDCIPFQIMFNILCCLTNHIK